ncbi:hypothetical protein SD457_09895 [Coprobacillaceae bacterium CR2/5/TPMF4]|nr:hypothetical protein SD457_09895 [Coprobacillaceae bacterium CR2/5/TPMF4]
MNGVIIKKGIGEIIKAKNYVGIIAMKDGTVIEILPKIYSSKKYDTKSVKLLLIEMLKTLKILLLNLCKWII